MLRLCIPRPAMAGDARLCAVTRNHVSIGYAKLTKRNKRSVTPRLCRSTPHGSLWSNGYVRLYSVTRKLCNDPTSTMFTMCGRLCAGYNWLRPVIQETIANCVKLMVIHGYTHNERPFRQRNSTIHMAITGLYIRW